MSPTRSYKYLFNPTTHQQFQLQPLKFHKLKLRGMFNNPWPFNFHIKTFNHVEFKITKNRNSQPTDSPFSSSFVSVALPPHRTPRLPAAPARRLPPPLPPRCAAARRPSARPRRENARPPGGGRNGPMTISGPWRNHGFKGKSTGNHGFYHQI